MSVLAQRRKFIQYTIGAYLLGPCLGQSPRSIAKVLTSQGEEWLLLNSAPKSAYGKSSAFSISEPGSIEVLQLASGLVKSIPLEFFGHTLSQNSQKKDQIATFEQYGSRGALIDLKTQKILAAVKCKKTNTFMGHAEFISEMNCWTTTEHNHEKNQGEVTIRDSNTLEAISSINTNGGKPHDCRYLAKQKQLVVINAATANIVTLDLDKKFVTKNIPLKPSETKQYSHFDITADGWIFAAARKGTGKPNLIDPNGLIETLLTEDQAYPGILSIAFIKHTNLVAATSPENDTVEVWNYRTKELKCTIKVKEPRGIMVDHDSTQSSPTIVVSLGKEKLLKKIKLNSQGQNPIITEAHHGFGGTGSHLVNIRI